MPPLCQSHCDLMKSLLAKLRLYHHCSGIRCHDFIEVLYNDTERMITRNIYIYICVCVCVIYIMVQRSICVI